MNRPLREPIISEILDDGALIVQPNSSSDTKILEYYCTQCPWKGAVTRTVTLMHGNLIALLLNPRF